MPVQPQDQRVIVTDIHMPFLSMVVFMVKWAIAAIPAFVILMAIGALTWGMLIGMVLSLGAARHATTAVPARATDRPVEAGKATGTAKADETAYLERVAVKGVSVEGATIGGRGVFGEVKNEGERTLFEVEITIYCLDKTKNRIFEKTYHPVLVSDFSMGDSNAPLKPGYSRKFGVRMDDAPSEWNGQVEVKVTGVEFAKPKGGA
jgi:hypothetical protein